MGESQRTTAGADSDDVIISDLVGSSEPAVSAPPVTCVRCGYHLTGRETGDRCPECNAPGAWSRADATLGYASPRWLGRLLLGARLVMAAYVLFAVGTLHWLYLYWSMPWIAPFTGSWSVIACSSAGAILLAAVLGPIGFFLLSARDPAECATTHGRFARLLLRIATLVTTAVGALFMTLHLFLFAPASAIGLASMITVTTSIALWCVLISSCHVAGELLLRRFGRPYDGAQYISMNLVAAFAALAVSRLLEAMMGRRSGLWVPLLWGASLLAFVGIVRHFLLINKLARALASARREARCADAGMS